CNRVMGSPIPPDDALAHQVCLARGVEWWKSNDAAFGALGFDGTGVLTAPGDTFARHGRSLIPLKQQFGVAEAWAGSASYARCRPGSTRPVACSATLTCAHRATWS